MRPTTCAALVLLLSACPSEDIVQDDPIVGAEPCLVPTADRIDLVVDVPGEQGAEIGLRNSCADVDVSVLDITIEGSDLWTLEELELPSTLPPGALLNLPVHFATTEGVVADARLTITTDDAEQRSIEIPLHAVGNAPRIRVTPIESLELGELTVGCETGWDIEVDNVGGAPLIVHNAGVAFLRNGGIGSLEAPELPWTLDPGESLSIGVQLHATRAGPDGAYVQLDNNDPNEPLSVSLARFDAVSYQQASATDIWRGDRVDLLVALDRSEGMRAQHEALLAWLPNMSGWASNQGLDMHVAVISAEDGCVVGGPVWTTEATTTSESLLAMADLDGRLAPIGDAEPRLLERLVAATSDANRQGCNAGLLRHSARTHMLLQTNNSDLDHGAWRDRLQSLRSVRAHAGDVVVHGLIGGGDCGVESAGLAALVDATGGVQGSACEAPVTLGRAMTTSLKQPALPRLNLPSPAVTGAIDVRVNYREAEHYSWTLVDAPPAVLFDMEQIADGTPLGAIYEVMPPDEVCE